MGFAKLLKRTGGAVLLAVLGCTLPTEEPTLPELPDPDTTAFAAHSVLHGFTGFPHDLTPTSLDEVADVIRERANLAVVHGDVGCLPWRQLLASEPLPAWIRNDWQATLPLLPSGPRYISVTPTLNDRRTLAHQCGEKEGATEPIPAQLDGVPLDHPLVKEAFTEYARQMASAFDPTFMIVGIEMSELALQHPAEWPAFERLARHTISVLKSERPALHVGVEFVLQSLMKPTVAEMVRPLVDDTDFIGISFYPYGGAYGVAVGAPALPAPPDEWRTPLTWLRGYTSQPIAIAETGYTTKNRYLESVDLWFPGNEALQASFMRDLLQMAIQDRYLFLVWFVPVDYEALAEKLGGPEAMWIWVNAGLFRPDFSAKPALADWDRFHEAAR